MKKLLISLKFIFLIYMATATSACTTGGYWQKQRIVFAIYGNDCVNCYLGASSAYQQLREKYAITFILGGVGKRIADSFMQEKIGSLNIHDSIILSDSLFNCFCPSLSSSVLVIRENRICTQMPFKSLDWPALQKIISEGLYTEDTININAFAGTAQTGFSLKGNNEIDIYNNISSVMYTYNYVEKRLIRKYDFKFLKDSTDAFIKACVELNASEKEVNKQQNDAIVAKMGSRVVMMRPYLTPDAIYVPLAFRVAKMMKLEDQKDSTLALMPSQFIVKLDKSFKPIDFYSFPWQLKGALNIFNDVHDGKIENNSFWMVTGSVLNDSLIAQYSLNHGRGTLENVYNFKTPPYFPFKNKFGMRMGFSGFFADIANQSCYVFNVDPVLHFFKADKSVTLVGFDTARFTTDGDPVNWISSVSQCDGNIIVTGGKQKGPTYLYIYDSANYNLKQKIKISDEQPNIIGYQDKKIYMSQLGDENAFLIIKDISKLLP